MNSFSYIKRNKNKIEIKNKKQRVSENIEYATQTNSTQVKLTLKPTELFSLKKIQFILEREFEIKNLRRRNSKSKDLL